MRYYLIDNDQKEHIIDLTNTKIHSKELLEFEFTTVNKETNTSIKKQRIFIRHLANQYFASTDGVSWNKMARQNLPNKILHIDQVMNLYRGFRPSSLNSNNEGELTVKMPGKVIKILVEVGEEVKSGQSVVILEAMKMENEIKCGKDGQIKAIHIKQGDNLEQGIVMMEIG